MEERFTKAVVRMALLFAAIWHNKAPGRSYLRPTQTAKEFENYVWGNDQDGPTANS